MRIKEADLSILQKGIILVMVPLFYGLALFSLLSFFLHQAELETEREARASSLRALVSRGANSTWDALRTLTFFLHTRQNFYRHRLDQIRLESERIYAEIGDMVRDQPEERQLVNRLHTCGKDAFTLFDNGTRFPASRDTLDFLEQQRIIKTSRRLVEEMATTGEQLMQLEQQRDRLHPTASNFWRNQLKLFLAAAVLGNIIVCALLALFFGRSISSRLGGLERNAVLLSEGKPLLPRLNGTDEIASLDHTFHAMAVSLEETMRRERALTENARDVICSIDRHSRFVAVNPASSILWGYTPDELVGKEVATILPPEDTDVLFLKKPMAETSLSFENRIVHKCGAVEHMLWSVSWSDAQQLYVCVAHRITDRKLAEQLLQESEDRLGAIMETMPVLLLLVSKHGEIKAVNQTALSKLGSSRDAILGTNVRELIRQQNGDDTLLMDRLIEEYLGSSGELFLARANDKELPVELHLSGVQLFGEPHFLMVMLDITERFNMNVLKTGFVEMIGSDLRKPIATVHEVLHELGRDTRSALTDKGRKYIAQSEQETERLKSLIEALLAAERLQAGKMVLDVGEHSCIEIVRRATAAVQPLADKYGIVVHCDLEEILIPCDSSRLVQVLVNLLANAIKYSPPQGSIKISGNHNQQWLQLSISDEGRGIPKELREVIFERFVQVEHTDSTQKGGFGLGLSICKKIIDQHGGTISVESEEAKGSTFCIRLPLTPTDNRA